ncbi:MAG: hypothetical protein SH807_01005 [Blastochloris sp.]|nr:hypothetical protein [Blastochloris sp.]
MRLSVEIEDSLMREVMRLTGETKMSTAIAKATELFANRKKAASFIRSLREEPLNYEWTNDQIESWGEVSLTPPPASIPDRKVVRYGKKPRTKKK